MKPQPITEFRNQYRWLSNFWRPVRIAYQGVTYWSVESAYQAAKEAPPQPNRHLFTGKYISPGEAKRAGRGLVLRPDWEQVKNSIMLDLLRLKFKDLTLRQKLLATGAVQLVEGNTWGDVYWGVCRGVGENHLGRLLMQVRKEISATL
jgi:ribA/ribD-fused uncharacterized protein